MQIHVRNFREEENCFKVDIKLRSETSVDSFKTYVFTKEENSVLYKVEVEGDNQLDNKVLSQLMMISFESCYHTLSYTFKNKSKQS